MNQSEIARQLYDNLRRQAIELDDSVVKNKEALEAAEEKLSKNIVLQHKELFVLIQQTLQEQDQMYCRSCAQLKSAKTAKYLAVEHHAKHRGRNSDDFWTRKDIIRQCEECGQRDLLTSPRYGPYQSDIRDQTYYNAQEVELNDNEWTLVENKTKLNPKEWYFADELFYECHFLCGHYYRGKNDHSLHGVIEGISELLGFPFPLETMLHRNIKRLKIAVEKSTAAKA
jgi:hypothetical protein